jgi:predicted metal-dependent peptidase
MPKLPFHLKLYEYLNRGIGGEVQWETLNRRYIHRRLYLPSETKVVMGEVVFAVDTSGSMGQEQLSLAFGYVRTFRQEHPCKMHVIQCDHDAVGDGQYQVYEEYEEMPVEIKAFGRGGTSFDPPFRLIEEKRIEPKVMIYVTDGYGACTIKQAPAFPVLWVVVGGDREFKPPFGELVVVEG